MATQSPQKNKRLSDRDRGALIALAKTRIEETQGSVELDIAYELAADAIHDAFVALYPQKDMRVLAKYKTATDDPCIYVSTGGHNYDEFCFRDGDKRIPLRPNRMDCNWRTPIALEPDARAAYETFDAAKKAHKEAMSTRLTDFRALISSVPTFNAVVEVWPDAEALRASIVGQSTALLLLSNDVVERLKADPANTLAEAA